MVRKNRLNHLALAAILVLLTRCAQTVPLTGGPDDKTPPVLVRSEPDTFQTDFSSDKIRLEFDEFVELDNVRKNLLVTPVLRYQPTVLANGKKITVRHLDDSLWPNTTYVMEFNEAVRDITEHNISKGFRYVFSTGSFVDSLQLAGIIRDAFTLEPVADAFAFIYASQEDSLPYIETPRYVGRSDKNGVFRIRNMKAGRYQIFFCTDDNRNYKYDLPSEQIDFSDSVILVKEDTIGRYFGYLFRENSQQQYLQGYGSVQPGSFYLVYNLPFDSLYFHSEGRDLSWLDHFRKEVNDAGDSVVYWKSDTVFQQDTIDLIIRADTADFDTLRIGLLKEAVHVKVSPAANLSGGNLELGQELRLEFPFPVMQFDKSKLKLMHDSTQAEVGLILGKAGRDLTILGKWTEGDRYELVLDSAAFIDIHGKANDSVIIPIMVRKAGFYGTLELKLGKDAPSDGILQLIDAQGKVVEEVYLKSTEGHYFPYLHPGEYRLKFLHDKNRNQIWDTGNYAEKRHAESVFIYQSTIIIRSNWDQVIEWKFN